tara:strand:+ start:60 stop:650 length:591 start_codon:yes stop_codon:yes gene_type:complete
MLSTFGAGSARAFGMNAAAAEKIYGVIQSGPDWDSSLFESGDIIIRSIGALNSLPAGNIWSVRCTTSWSQPYYEGGSLSYQLSSSNMQGQCYIHYRAKSGGPAGYSLSNLSVTSAGASRSITYNSSDVNGRRIRVAASGGYNFGSASAGGGSDPLLKGTSLVGGASLSINANSGTQTTSVASGNFVRVSGACLITI